MRRHERVPPSPCLPLTIALVRFAAGATDCLGDGGEVAPRLAPWVDPPDPPGPATVLQRPRSSAPKWAARPSNPTA